MPSKDLKNLNCELTLFEGKIVYKSEKSPVTISLKNQSAKTN
jgi:hypothetical protein